MSTLILILVIIGLLITTAVIFLKLCYITLPNDMALLVNGQKVYFNDAITLPSNKKIFIPLVPIRIKSSYVNEQGILSKEKLLLDIVIRYQVCIAPNPTAILEASSKLGAENLADEKAIRSALQVVLGRNLRAIVAELSYEVVDKDRGKLRKQLMSSLQNQLYGYHIDYLDIEKIELTLLEALAGQDHVLIQQQEFAMQTWSKYQREQLEKSLKLVTDRQLELSTKIKALIADYQRVIRQKINVFINRVG